MAHSDYLSILIEQSTGATATIQPRILPIFASDLSPSGTRFLTDILFPEPSDYSAYPDGWSTQPIQGDQRSGATASVAKRPGSLPPRVAPAAADASYRRTVHAEHSDQAPGKQTHDERSYTAPPTSSPMPAPSLSQAAREAPASAPHSDREPAPDWQKRAVAPGSTSLPAVSSNRTGEQQGGTPAQPAPAMQPLSEQEPPAEQAHSGETRKATSALPSPLAPLLQQATHMHHNRSIRSSQEERSPAPQTGAEGMPPPAEGRPPDGSLHSLRFPPPIPPASQGHMTTRQPHDTTSHPIIASRGTGTTVETALSKGEQGEEITAQARSERSAPPVYNIQPVPTPLDEPGDRETMHVRPARSRQETRREQDNNEPGDRQRNEPQMEQQVPRIEVSIGRVEVRATPSSHPPTSRRAPVARPALSLQDYLAQRRKGQS